MVVDFMDVECYNKKVYADYGKRIGLCDCGRDVPIMSNYTQRIEDHYWNNVAAVRRATKSQLRAVRTGDSESELPAIIEQFRIDHTCSARRYLMNFFQNHGRLIDVLDQFSYTHKGKVYLFQRATGEHARMLDADERDTYIRLICAVAAENTGTEEKDWRPLARKAMLWNKQPEQLSKEEVFRLGHGLRMTLQEVDDFILRVLDNDGLSYARSEDVIEAFCFLHEPANDPTTAASLKAQYKKATKNIEKQEPVQKAEGFTVAMEMSLQSRIRRWENQEVNVQDTFLQWLIGRAPWMDLPSQSAKGIYCRLAQLAYNWTVDPLQIPDEANFSNAVLDYCLQGECTFIEPHMAYRMTEQILNNASVEFDNLRKRQNNQIWRYLTVDQKGNTTAVAIGNRIPQLLLGEEPVTKADVLFMIWYIGDLCWTESSISGQVIYDRTADFWSVSEKLLDEANLPDFYAPHMLERCFLKAICTRNEIGEYPFEIYEGMCEFVLPEKQERKRSKQGSRMELSRAELEKEAMQAFLEEKIDFGGIARKLAEHFRQWGEEKGKYLFDKEGIAYLPDPRIVISFSDPQMSEIFDMDCPAYKQEEAAKKRFVFVFGLSLYLKQEMETLGVRCDFRTNYQKYTSLTVLRWEENGH